VWNLFKYILSNRKKMLSTGELIDVVWGEDYCENPEKALQNLIYRLRQFLSVNIKADDLIISNQGCYKWNDKFPVWIDCDALVEYGETGKQLLTSSPYDARQCFEKVIDLYNGEFLSDIIYDIWVLPLRTMYKKRYTDYISSYLEVLDATRDFETVVRVCDNFFSHEFFDEKSNLYFLKALISLERKQEAQKHYDIMAEVMYRELGVHPSYKFADILKEVRESPAKSEIKEVKNITLELVNDMLWQDERTSGAFQCDKDTFMATSKVMLRNLERSGLSIMLVLATFSEVGKPDAEEPKKPSNSNISFVTFKKPEPPKEKEKEKVPDNSIEMDDAIEEARKKFVYAFRRGDIVCLWNSKQILIMLTNLTFEDAETAMERINKKIQTEILKENYTLNYKIIPLEHEII
jgi:DNA-binding SARP family transcriptional activator